MGVCGSWKKCRSERPKGTAGMGRAVALIVLVLLPFAGCANWAVDMAPDRHDAPWIPATSPAGEIAAGERGPADQPTKGGYILPSNRSLAAIPPPASALERHRPYSLPELIDIAQSNNPV